MGYDLFDCVLPTRNARNGTLFTSSGRLNIRNARYARDPAPVDPSCACYRAQRFSRAYLRHLARRRRDSRRALNTIHNLHFYLELMRDIAPRIAQRRFPEYASPHDSSTCRGEEAQE